MTKTSLTILTTAKDTNTLRARNSHRNINYKPFTIIFASNNTLTPSLTSERHKHLLQSAATDFNNDQINPSTTASKVIVKVIVANTEPSS